MEQSTAQNQDTTRGVHKMANTKLDDFQNEKPSDIPFGLTWCSACYHMVPDALICLWCGAHVEGVESGL